MGLSVFTKAAIEKRSSVVLHSPRPRGKNVYTHVLEDIHDKVFMTIDIADNDTPKLRCLRINNKIIRLLSTGKKSGITTRNQYNRTS